jgi:hypothetical protein
MSGRDDQDSPTQASLTAAQWRRNLVPGSSGSPLDVTGKNAMPRLSYIAVLSIALIALLAIVLLYVAYGYVAAAPNKDDPTFLFWMEVTKPISQLLYVAIAGGIIAGFIKILTDSVQSRRQIEETKNQFRKDVISGFISARYEATERREKFLNARSDKLEGLYRSMMEDDFIVIKEKLSRAWHDVETGKQSLTKSKAIEDNVIAMKGFFQNMIDEYRSVKDTHIPDTMEFYMKLPFFGDLLQEGSGFNSFVKNYRDTLQLIRRDLFGKGNI